MQCLLQILWRSCQLPNLVQVLYVNRNRDIRRVSVIQEMGKPDLRWNRADHLAKARHLEVFYLPDFEHERAEFLADEAKPVIVEINSVKMVVGQALANGITR